jgi:hypothetical protein
MTKSGSRDGPSKEFHHNGFLCYLEKSRRYSSPIKTSCPKGCQLYKKAIFYQELSPHQFDPHNILMRKVDRSLKDYSSQKDR